MDAVGIQIYICLSLTAPHQFKYYYQEELAVILIDFSQHEAYEGDLFYQSDFDGYPHGHCIMYVSLYIIFAVSIALFIYFSIY